VSRDLLMHRFANRPKGSAPGHRGLWRNSTLLSRRLDLTARVQEAEQRPLRRSMLALIDEGKRQGAAGR